MSSKWCDRHHACHDPECKRVWVLFSTKPDRSCPFCGSTLVTFTVVPKEATA